MGLSELQKLQLKQLERLLARKKQRKLSFDEAYYIIYGISPTLSLLHNLLLSMKYSEFNYTKLHKAIKDEAIKLVEKY